MSYGKVVGNVYIKNEDEKQRTSLTRRNELVESLMNYILNVAE